MVRWELTPHLGTTQQFTSLREFLQNSGYQEDAVRSRMGIAGLHQYLGMHSTGPADDVLELLIQLFLLTEAVPEASVRAWLPQPVLDLLTGLGLVATDAGGAVHATVALYPLDGVYVVSDVNQNREKDGDEATTPRVFSAATPQTADFLKMLPQDPCPSFLELCAGAGAAAMIAASSYAVQSFALDISARSTHFAEFSRRLNGLGNLSVVQGDLYAPAGRRTFDRIAAHPPYVPSLRSEQLFRDGGEDGEWLTRRIVAGLPNYLHPGGEFYCLCLMADVSGQPLVDRIRGWLREREREFDVAVLVHRTVDPVRLIFDNWSTRYSQPGDLQRWQNVLKKNRIEEFVYVTLLLQRHAEEVAPLTMMRRAGTVCTTGDLRALLRWEQSVARQGPESVVEPLVPRVSDGVTVHTRRSVARHQEAETHYSFAVDSPFRCEGDGSPWIAGLLEQADGTQSARRLHETIAPPDVEWAEFAAVIAGLVSVGLLRLPA